MDLEAAVAFRRFGGVERPALNVRASARPLPAACRPVLSFSSRGSSLGDSFPGEPAENHAVPPGSAALAFASELAEPPRLPSDLYHSRRASLSIMPGHDPRKNFSEGRAEDNAAAAVGALPRKAAYCLWTPRCFRQIVRFGWLWPLAGLPAAVVNKGLEGF